MWWECRRSSRMTLAQRLVRLFLCWKEQLFDDVKTSQSLGLLVNHLYCLLLLLLAVAIICCCCYLLLLLFVVAIAIACCCCYFCLLLLFLLLAVAVSSQGLLLRRKRATYLGGGPLLPLAPNSVGRMCSIRTTPGPNRSVDSII